MNRTTKRTFIAFKVFAGPEILDSISHLRQSLGKERIKWVDPARLHITTTFIGDTTAEQVESIGKIMEKYVPLCSSQMIRIHDIGVFRNLRDPRVVWMGMDTIPYLNELKVQIDKELEQTGLSIERREFKPHLTLGRIKSLNNKALLAELIQKYKGKLFQVDKIDALILFESVLKPGGPDYFALKKVMFKYDGP